jgi:hypothetical protein
MSEGEDTWFSIAYTQDQFTYELKPMYKTDNNTITASFKSTIFGNGKPIA